MRTTHEPIDDDSLARVRERVAETGHYKTWNNSTMGEVLARLALTEEDLRRARQLLRESMVALADRRPDLCEQIEDELLRE